MLFCCELCKKSFVSAFSLAEHFRSKEHKIAAGETRVDDLVEKLLDTLKKNIQDESSEFTKV